jgi:hypothetical protein
LHVLQILWQRRGWVATYIELHSASALPLERLDSILERLAGAGWLMPNGPSDWVLSVDLSAITAADVYEAVIFKFGGYSEGEFAAGELEWVAREVSSRIVMSLQISLEALFAEALSDSSSAKPRIEIPAA